MPTVAFTCSLRIFPLIVLYAGVTALTAPANQIVWGTSVSPGDVNFDSTGTPLDASFTFALGTFGAAFNPNASNVSLWASNWKVLDTAVYNPAYDYFASETNLSDNSVFAAGEKAYIWIYNRLLAGPGSEWLLMRGVDKDAVPWTIPASPGNVTSFPLDFRISRVTEVAFGAANGLVGPGAFSNSPDPFVLQTHTFMSIPEPGSSGLLAGGLLGLLRRRRPGRRIPEDPGLPAALHPSARSVASRAGKIRLVSRLAVLSGAGVILADQVRDPLTPATREGIPAGGPSLVHGGWTSSAGPPVLPGLVPESPPPPAPSRTGTGRSRAYHLPVPDHSTQPPGTAAAPPVSDAGFRPTVPPTNPDLPPPFPPAFSRHTAANPTPSGPGPDPFSPMADSVGIAHGVMALEDPPGSISGAVLEDTDNNNAGDSPIPGVTLTLKNGAGAHVDSDPGMPGVQPTTTTSAGNGSYSFTGLRPGTYRVVESQPAGYVSVLDVDGENLDEIGDVEPIVVSAGADTADQTFVDELAAALSGFVLVDTGTDDIGDAGIVGVTLTLFTDPDGNGNPGDGVVVGNPESTAADGSFSFSGLGAGPYVVVESQPAGYLNRTDGDLTADAPGSPPDAFTPASDDYIAVNLKAGELDTGNTFVEALPGSITGFVLADINNDDAGEAPLPDVILTLKHGSGADVDSDPFSGGIQPTTTTTAPNGSYAFTGLGAGPYQVIETQPAGYFSVKDADGGDPDRIGNVTPIVLTSGGSAANCNFTEEEPGSIRGFVLADTDNDSIGDTPLSNVILTLLNGAGGVIDGDASAPGIQPVTAVTEADGSYIFRNVVPGSYGVAQTQPTGFASVGDADGGNPDEIRPIAVSAGIAGGGNDFVEEQPASISGLVLADQNHDGIGDTPVPNVTLTLKDGTGTDIDRDPGTEGLQATTTLTGPDGRYSFSGLPSASYQVVETQPAGYLSVSDADGGDPDRIGEPTPITLPAGGSVVDRNFIEELPGSISGSVLVDADNNGLGDTGLGNVQLTLKDAFGNDMDSDPGTAGVQPAVTRTLPDGSYTFAGWRPGSYQVSEIQPSGFLSLRDADGGDPDRIGDQSLIPVTAGGVTPGCDFTEIPEVLDSFASWKTWNGLSGSGGQPLPDGNGQGGNPDTDLYSNLLEYAFGFPPRSGVSPPSPHEVRITGGGRIDYAVTFANAPADLTISLEVAGRLGRPTVWVAAGPLVSTVTDNLNGNSTIVYEDLETLGAGFADGDGFVRVVIGLDTDQDNVPDRADRTAVTGWTDHTHAGWVSMALRDQFTTFAMPYLKSPLISGEATGNSLSGIDLTGAAGTLSVAGAFTSGRRYFVEITGGTFEGHRFEVDVPGCTAVTLAVATTSPVNTRSLTPGVLTGAPVVVRELPAFHGIFPPSVFLAGSSPDDSDSLLTYTGMAWQTFFLADLGFQHRWVAVGDPTLTDRGGEVLTPGMGVFVHRRGSSLTIARSGLVRENDMVSPLPGTGAVLTGSGYPVDQSYASRDMTVAAGFVGGVDLSLSSQVLFWAGDSVPGKIGYTTDFLLDGGSPPLQYWTGGDDSTLASKDHLRVFKATGAAFLIIPVARPGYVIPAQWFSAP